VIHADADELRESPWPELSLKQAIWLVDRAGFNVIDFALFNFWPIDDQFSPQGDLREAFPYYEPGQGFDHAQLKCWKKQPGPVDLVSTGGHEIRFPERSICPVRFILRHYPVRSQAHAERKIFRERVPRFIPAEQERGWHVQYAGMAAGQRFVRTKEELVRFEPQRIRAELWERSRFVDVLEAEHKEHRRKLEETISELHKHLDTRKDAYALLEQVLAQDREVLHAQLKEALDERDFLRQDRLLLLQDREAQLQRIAQEQEERMKILRSRTWRWTQALLRWLRFLPGAKS
jgi:hypothetical protein